MFCYYWKTLLFPTAITVFSSIPTDGFYLYHSCHQFIFRVSRPFGALGGFSIQLSSHFSPCPGSPFLQPALVTDSLPATRLWDRCQPGCAFAHTMQCLCAHTECRRGVLVWDHPLLLTQAPGTPTALPAPLSAAKSTKQNLSGVGEQTPPAQSSQCMCFAQNWVWNIYF